MAEYIERDEAIKAVMSAKWERGSDGAMAMEIVAGAPTADVRPERHGAWFGTVCTNCGSSTSFYYDCDYCPQCGAKMDGKEEDHCERIES